MMAMMVMMGMVVMIVMMVIMTMMAMMVMMVMMTMMVMMAMMVERVFGWKCGKSRQEVEGVEAKTLQGGFHAIQYTYTLEYTW